MIAMAWRSLYAETVKARMDDKTLNRDTSYSHGAPLRNYSRVELLETWPWHGFLLA